MRTTLVLIASLSLAGASLLEAQTTPADGPHAGSWAVEGSTSSATLLHFRSPTSAWLLSGAVDWVHQEQHNDNPLLDREDNQTVAQFQVGWRRYRAVPQPLRPFTSISLLARYADTGVSRTWLFGPALDIGASYFFTPHVSLGAMASASVAFGNYKTSPGGAKATTVQVSVGDLRLVGALYF